MVDFGIGAPVAGDLDVRWIHGIAPGAADTDPAFQVHAYDPHTYVLRQSKTANYEGPFIYLLFGNERALLLDTGATADSPLRSTVDGLMSDWVEANAAGPGYELVVAHTHAHGDHVAGDGQFADRSSTTVVGREVEAVREFFCFTDWPAQEVTFDLGGRVLEITGIPGHHPASILIYDPWSGFLLTGDTFLPGRLYAPEYSEFVASMDRMVEFAAGRSVSHVMGCHVEMSMKPGRDYPIGSRYQPDEVAIQMTVQQLVAARDAAKASTKPGVHRFDDFIIWNGPCRGATFWQLTRTLLRRATRRESAAP
ncbi:MAG TPA: MBL fold metallo-hydrolase [Streptosporangiaceae bacterium]|nr:MBL fold metallo-hydrolase [Streptosporangiaceae bacterium]